MRNQLNYDLWQAKQRSDVSKAGEEVRDGQGAKVGIVVPDRPTKLPDTMTSAEFRAPHDARRKVVTFEIEGRRSHT